MVNLCYLATVFLILSTQTLALSTQFAIEHSKPQVLSKTNRDYLQNSYPVNTPSQLLKKREPGSYKDAKEQIGKSNIRTSSVDAVIDEDPDPTSEEEEDETLINSYGFRNLQKKLRLSGKKFEMPVTGPVPDWDDQYYENGDKPIVYQVDTEELKDIMDNYIDMGKEKWAALLATSDCNKFQKLIKKFHNIMNKNEGGDEDDSNKQSPKKGHYATAEEEQAENDEEDEDESFWPDNKPVPKTYPMPNQVKLAKQKGLKKGQKQLTHEAMERQPMFSAVPVEELEELQQLFVDVINYWDKEDAKDILKAADGLRYKDFEIDEEKESDVRNNKSSKKNNKLKSLNVASENDNDDEEDEDDGSESETKAANENDEEVDENSYDDDDDEFQKQPELFEKFDPKFCKTKAQKEWLKANAIRRAKIIQELLNGDFTDEAMLIKQDEIRYRENNIFLDQDDNEFSSDGLRLQSTVLSLYIFFLVEAVFFYLF